MSPPPAPHARTDGGDATEPPEDSALFTFVLPLLGAVLLALGIAGVIVGGWSFLQPALGCGNPTIGVDSPEETGAMLEDRANIERIDYEDLSEAERRAVDEAIESVHGDATVQGELENHEALERGVVVTRNGTDRYVTIVAANECTEIDPLVFPLGLTSLFLGFVVYGLIWYRNTEWPDRRRARRR